MTNETTTTAGQAGEGGLRREVAATARLAAPIVVTQLAWVGMLTTDTAMIGHLGAEKLAGASLSGTLFFVAYVFSMGVVMATASLAAQAYGARQPRQVRRVVRQGLWVSAVVSLPVVAAFHFVPELLAALGQPPEVLPHAGSYMATLKWSLPTSVGFLVLRNFVSALNRPTVALWVMLPGLLANAALDYGLIFGRFGLPRLELTGAGIATTTVSIGMFAGLLAITVLRRPFARYAILGNFWRPDWRQFRAIFRIGLPIAGTVLIEVGFFIGVVFVIGRFGAEVIAAHMIALQLPHITFMVPMGLAQAATVRVGHAVGRRDRAGVRRSGWMAVALAFFFMAAMSVVIMSIPESFAAIFLDATRPDSQAVLALAVTFLFYAAFFQVADGVQAVAAGALRGLNDTVVPMYIAAISYWGVGLSCGFTFAFAGGMQGAGLWLGFVFGLFTAAILLSLRFRLLTRRGYLPALQAA